jgi:hypothetical protein
MAMKEFQLSKNHYLWLHVGYGKRLGFCISIDRRQFNFEFLCFWFSVEW